MKNKKIISIILILITLLSYFYISKPNITIQSISGIVQPVSAQQTSGNSSGYSENISKNTSLEETSSLSVNAEGAVLIDAKTGKLLYGKDENKKLYPASTTKILTAIIAIENCNLTDKITASYDAVMSLPSGYSNASIQPNETLTCQEFLEMFLIHSANEIGTILAEHISGNVEKFAILMNQKATEIGCKNTHFTNPSGIHNEEHYTTAYDMALIAQYCMQNQTFRNIVSKTSCTIEATDKYEQRYYRNTNDLLNTSSNYYYEYAIGTKTGYTSQAKRCLIATALKDGLELITVILGSQPANPDTRYLDTINLFEYGFNNYMIKQIATKDTVVKDLVIKNATKETANLSLVVKDDLFALTSSKSLSDLNCVIQLNEKISAPISEGEVLGKITYTIGENRYSSDLIANHSVEKIDYLKLLFQIGLAFLILFIISKIFLPNKKSKKRKVKSKKSGMNKNNNSIYKF